MNLSSGNYEIVSSGVSIGIKNEDITIVLPENHSNFKFIFEFIEDKSLEGSPSKFNIINDHTLKIQLFNLNSNITSGNTEIINLGHINNRELLLNYRVLGLNELSYTLIYTFYLKNLIK